MYRIKNLQPMKSSEATAPPSNHIAT